MDSVFTYVIPVLFFLTLVVTIRLSWRLVQGVFILSRTIEECWDKPLPEEAEQRTTQIQKRTKLDSQLRGLLQGSIIYAGFIILLPFVFGTAMGFYAFQLIGLGLLVTVLVRAGVHYWRRHER